MGCRAVLLAVGSAADSALVNVVEIEVISPLLLLMFPPMRDVLHHLCRIPQCQLPDMPLAEVDQ